MNEMEFKKSIEPFKIIDPKFGPDIEKDAFRRNFLKESINAMARGRADLWVSYKKLEQKSMTRMLFEAKVREQSFSGNPQLNLTWDDWENRTFSQAKDYAINEPNIFIA